MNHYLRILDKAALEAPLDENQAEYQFTGIIRTDGKNTSSSGESETYKAKFVSEIHLISKGKVLIRAKEKGSLADQMHRALVRQAEVLDENGKEYYEKKMKERIDEINKETEEFI